MNSCSHCGVRVPPSASRCPECGAPILSAVRPDLPAHSMPSEAAPKPPGRSPGCSLALGLGIGMVVVGGLAAVGMLFAGGVLMSTPAPQPPAPGPSEVSSQVQAPPPTPVPSPVPTGEGGFAAVKARGTLRVAADVAAPPFLSPTADGYEGFEYGLMSALAAEIGVPLTVVPTSFDALPEAVRIGAADLAIGQVSPATHWDGVSYSVSYLQYSLCLVTPKGSKVKRLADLAGKHVGTWDDPAVAPVLQAAAGTVDQRTYSADGYFTDLEAGKLDAVVYDCPLARHELKSHPALVVTDDAINVATYSVVTNASDPALLADTNRVLRKLGDQGLLARIEERWLGTASTATTTATGRVAIVHAGDTLATLAQRELGDAAKASDLHARNRDLLGDDPNALYAGLRLRIGP